MQILKNAPKRVSGVVMVAPAIEKRGGSTVVGRLLHLPPAIRWMQLGLRAVVNTERIKAIQRSVQGDPSYLTEDDYAVYLRGFQTPRWDIGILALARDSGRGQAKVADLTGVPIPALIVHGAADPVIPLATGRRVASLLVNSTMLEYADASHQPMEECAERFNQDVIAWLGDVVGKEMGRLRD